MDKIKLFLITLVVSFVCVEGANAQEQIELPPIPKFEESTSKVTNPSTDPCNSKYLKELKSKANYIKFDYEIIDNSTYKDIKIDSNKVVAHVPNYQFLFSVYNIIDELSVTITSSSNTSFPKSTITSALANDGIYTFTDNNFWDYYQYTITINPNNTYCRSKKLKSITITKPKYNPYSEYTYCKNSSLLYCQKFISSNLKINNSYEFLDKIQVNNEKNNPDKKSSNLIIELIKNNWKLYLLIFIGAIIIIVAGTMFIRMKNVKKRWKL